LNVAILDSNLNGLFFAEGRCGFAA